MKIPSYPSRIHVNYFYVARENKRETKRLVMQQSCNYGLINKLKERTFKKSFLSGSLASVMQEIIVATDSKSTSSTFFQNRFHSRTIGESMHGCKSLNYITKK